MDAGHITVLVLITINVTLTIINAFLLFTLRNANRKAKGILDELTKSEDLTWTKITKRQVN